MILFSTMPVLLALALLVLLHLLSTLFEGIVSKVLTYINISLHVFLVIPLLIYDFSFEEGVLVYMISITFYTLFGFIRYLYEKKQREASKRYFDKKREDKAV